ncbi:MAG: hypothetical protein ACOZQL_02060 [Myxococcota bacterium]
MRSLLLALTLAPLLAHADCREWSWSVFPEPGELVPTNARFVVQGYGLAQDAVKTIASRHPRLVTSAGEEFPLKVVELHVGEFHLTQAVLSPKGALTPGVQYTLRFDQPDGPERFWLSKDTSPTWFVGPDADFVPPRWKAAPTPLPSAVKEYGCGPAIEAQLAVQLDDASPVLVRARVTGPDQRPREYLLRLKDGKLIVGHSMCSGAFVLDPEGEWQLELTAVDLAGNTAAAPGGALRFKGLTAAPK